MRQSVNAVKKERPDIFDFLKGDAPLIELFSTDTHIEKNRIKKYKDCYSDIGNTPIHKVKLKNNNTLYVKLEYHNGYGYNHYCRYWFIYFFIAETLGLINKNSDTILEVTSGSSGIALSNVCRKLDYKLKIIVPKGISKARLKAMEGDHVEFHHSEGYLEQCVEDFRKIRKDENQNYFTPNHAEEKSDIIIHVFKRIAVEFFNELQIIPDYNILAIGNGSSTKGVLKYYYEKENKESMFNIGFHPNIQKSDFKPILGLRPPNVKFRHIDSLSDITTEIEFTDKYNIESIRNKYFYDSEIEKFGVTSLYAIAIAEEYAKKCKNKIFFSIAYDKIEMYDDF